MKSLTTLTKALLLLALTSIFSLFSVAQGWRDGEMEINVKLQQKQDAKTLHELGLIGDIYMEHALMYVTPAELERVKAAGLKYEITKENLNEYYKDFWETRDQYHTYQEIIAVMDSLANALPDLVMKVNYGTSVGGRELSALKISDNVNLNEPEPEIGFDGNIHGDEIGGGENMIRFARWLCQQHNAGNPQITELINTREIWIFPLVNPDGKVNLTRYNNNGVDLNRDWGYIWDGEGNSPGPYSQPESKALRQMAFDNNFTIHMTLHSGIEMYLHPWYFYQLPCPDADEEETLADMYASTSGYANLVTGPGTSLYPTTGSTAESYYGVKGSHGIVMELSSNKQPPPSQIGYYFNINLQPTINLIEYAGYGINGMITDAQTAEPVAAIIYVGEKMTCFSDPEVGDYHKFVVGGTYNIKVKANGYQTQMINNVVIEDFAATTLDIQMQPEEHHSIYQVLASRRPTASSSNQQPTWDIIGPPDNKSYSMGKTGWIVFDMGDLVVDGAGNDIIVFEGDATPEGFSLYAGTTMDGPWILIGEGVGTSEFDFAGSAISEARYFRILDDGDGGNEADAGFDLDAMQAMSSINGPYILLDNFTINDENGNNNGQLDPGETAIISITLKNIGTEEAGNVFGELITEDSYVEISTFEPQEFGTIETGATAFAEFELTAAEDTPAGHTATLTLDYSGDNGLSGSKFIDLTFPDYCYPTANCSWGDGFTGFELEEISNMNSGCSGDNGVSGYGNFTDMTTVLVPGETYTVQWQSGYDSQFACLWIDMNDDKDFSFDELLIEDFEIDNSGQTYSTTFTLPENIPAGQHRLRIRARWLDSSADPCGNFNYGETEDYTVIVESGNFLSPAFAADITEFCEQGTVQFTDLSQGEITTWAWEFPGGEPAISSEQNPEVYYALPGIFDVSLTVSNSSNSQTLEMENYIQVHELPEVTFDALEDMCINWPAHELTEGFPEGGEYSGNGVVDGWFHPEVAGLGNHIITYHYTDENGCENSAEQTVFVDACTGIDEMETAISIYPNPSKGKIIITTKTNLAAGSISVVDGLGNKVWFQATESLNAGDRIIIQLKNPTPGIYYVILKSESRKVKKVVVE
jgi:PKD repeat protein